MIVPQYWAEARLRDRVDGRQVTVRRWGWSDESPAAALAHAEARAAEAMARVRAGEVVPRRERKIAYNGADGFPIREEVLARHGDAVVTRNSYGARCLNTPNALFLDIDFPELPQKLGWLFLAPPLAAALTGYFARSWPAALGALVATFALVGWIVEWAARRADRTGDRYEDDQRAALERVAAFVDARPDWELRAYRTPKGLRLLATHRPFDPNEPEVQEAFAALGVDPLYALMCRNQKCFRARVSPKPWRLDVRRIRPRPGVWPLAPQWLPVRAEWVAEYEAASAGFASCRYLATFGTGGTHPTVRPVVELHDEFCRATADLPLA